MNRLEKGGRGNGKRRSQAVFLLSRQFDGSYVSFAVMLEMARHEIPL